MCLQNDAFATYRETEIVPAGDVFNVFLSTATFVVDDLQLKTTQEICLNGWNTAPVHENEMAIQE